MESRPPPPPPPLLLCHAYFFYLVTVTFSKCGLSRRLYVLPCNLAISPTTSNLPPPSPHPPTIPTVSAFLSAIILWIKNSVSYCRHCQSSVAVYRGRWAWALIHYPIFPLSLINHSFCRHKAPWKKEADFEKMNNCSVCFAAVHIHSFIFGDLQRNDRWLAEQRERGECEVWNPDDGQGQHHERHEPDPSPGDQRRTGQRAVSSHIQWWSPVASWLICKLVLRFRGGGVWILSSKDVCIHSTLYTVLGWSHFAALI